VALVRKFVHRPDAPAGFRSQVECGYRIAHEGSKRLLHLETYGSSGRAIPGKTSQSIQLDREAAKRLRELIDEAFPDLAR
jgi:hypothetical protein